MLGLTWNEIGLALFFFLMVFVVGLLPRVGDFIGDVVYGFRKGRSD